MDYDEFSNDNNPFAGSNHFYSNGISSNDPSDLLDSGTSLGVQSVDSEPLPIITNQSVTISNYELLRDFKNVTTVFYRIEYMSKSTLRRYSDFVSLRSYLIRFFQTKVLPPVPEKHSLGRLLKNPFSYKSDTKIIYRRIRLLQYFLDELVADPDIKQSEVLLKFLDPSQKNWHQAIKSGPLSNVSSKSILLTSPRNPLIPNPYLIYLPIPPLGLVKKYDSKLNSSIFVPLEAKVKILLERVQALEQTSKKIVKDLEKNRIALIELGSIFNIFSILENQDRNIEEFGNRVDLSFLNIEVLIKSITVKMFEPFIILRQTLVAMVHLLNYRKLKELQLSYLRDIILRKQVRLKSLMERVVSESKLSQILENSVVDSPSLNKAINELKLRKQKQNLLSESSLIIINKQLQAEDDDESFIRDHNQDTPINNGHAGNWKTAIAGTSSSASSNKIHTMSASSHKSVSKLSADELASEISKIRLELNEKLIPCYTNLIEDVKFVSIDIERNINKQLGVTIQRICQVMNDWKTVVYGDFVQSCLGIWSQNHSLT
ncbi:hypothetical protein OGAPHI_001672 [Ogataea philodendri]|uniref:PX domain-containing protein n=1 Tax=Ogataea philodendri TaxID=1378263 RepID=A0A9P8T7Q8_9ASCO|nr:uncharacterized protein OGAPHI_001672 [Ogataea philodendri]KAH3669076.1 hypothetical protein OGAPHI_001672 [Ogataea philodendri]